MVAVKAHQASSFLHSLDPRYSAILFYGPDAGLVAERAGSLAAASAARFEPRGEVLRIDDGDLDGDPERLAVELGTIPMFGGRKIVRVGAGRRVNAASLRPLLEGEALEGVLIVEAGNLRPDDALRALFEKSGRAAAIPCFADTVQDLDALVRETLAKAGLAISSEALEALLGRLGADRALSRSEVEKLALYARGQAQIEIGDVEAVVGDASELTVERIYFAAAAGERTRAVAECSRAVATGESPQSIIAATQRHFQKLHRTRGAIEKGRSIDDALRQMRPPLHFKQKDAFAAQCRTWTSERLAEALRRIAATAKAARLSHALEEALTERLLMSLSALARDRGDSSGRR